MCKSRNNNINDDNIINDDDDDDDDNNNNNNNENNDGCSTSHNHFQNNFLRFYFADVKNLTLIFNNVNSNTTKSFETFIKGLTIYKQRQRFQWQATDYVVRIRNYNSSWKNDKVFKIHSSIYR